MAPLKLSHTSVKMYSECSKKYFLWYQKNKRPKVTHGALLFGNAVDKALNLLLETKDLDAATALFKKTFTDGEINRVPTFLPYSPLVVYGATDFDGELLAQEDIEAFQTYASGLGIFPDELSPKDIVIEDEVAALLEVKKQHGFDYLTPEKKSILAYAHWLSMYRKGEIMLKSYSEKILPKIKQVLAIQKKSSIVNPHGDEITIYLDLIVELHDGTRWLLDNKTTVMEYTEFSPQQSQQLILYYHSEKDEYGLDGVGFIPIYKTILKNRTKICSSCHKDGSGQRHKTCDAEIDGKRCNAAWYEAIKPEARIEMLLNKVPEAAESLVIETFDAAAEGIKAGSFGPNLSACKMGTILCPFYNLCWKGSEDDLTEMPPREDK